MRSPRGSRRAGLKFIVVTDHGDATRAPDAPVYREGSCASTASRSARPAATTSRSTCRKRRIRSAARHAMSSTTWRGSAGSGSRPTRIRRSPSSAGASGPRPSTAIEFAQPGHELAEADRAGVRGSCDAADAVARAAAVFVPVPPGRVHRRAAATDRRPDDSGRTWPAADASSRRRRGRARADRVLAVERPGRNTGAIPIPELRVIVPRALGPCQARPCADGQRGSRCLGDRAGDSRRAPVPVAWTASRRRPLRVLGGEYVAGPRAKATTAGGGRAREAARTQQRPGVVHDDDP